MQFKDTRRIIAGMPKVEIHLHLEGAFTFDFLFELVQKYGGDPEIKCIDDLRAKFVFRDFSHFIKTWFWKNQFFRTADDFEESVYRTVGNLSAQNVIYAEVFFSPFDFAPSGLKVESIIEATISGIKRAEEECPIKIGLIADIVRDHGAETALKRLDVISQFKDKGIIGVGLGGNEKDFPPALFKNVFIEAKRRGFRTTVHAGEAAGPESIWSALNDLEAERIGHGVRAVEDPKLVDHLKEKQIPLEVCITSNLRTNVFPSLSSHPFASFYKQGILVTINSDDPPMFGADITDELLLLNEKLGYKSEDLAKLTKNGVEASFIEAGEKKVVIGTIEDYFSSEKNIF